MDLIMGMNSGSSFDGIDVVLAKTEIDSDGFPKAPKFLKGGSYDWPEDVKKIVIDSFDNKIDMVGINRLNYICGAVFAEKAVQFMKENNIDPADIKVLGLDGQTIYQEQPDHKTISEWTEEQKANWPRRWLDGPYPSGIQMGDTSVIANLTNIDTVTHFRAADHTFGGSAAPLMPYLDFVLFRHDDKPAMTLNIGGIANLHVASKERKDMFGFDTGPGNVISNYMCRKLFDVEYDKDAEIAKKGKVSKELFDHFMSHPFFERPVPRSGWIADYSSDYINGVIAKFPNLPKEDFVLTACAMFGYVLSGSFLAVMLLAIPLGLGNGMIDTGLNSYVAANYEAHHMNWLHSFWGVGAMIGPAVMSKTIATSNSWRQGYLIVGIFQIGLIFILIFTQPLWNKVAKKGKN